MDCFDINNFDKLKTEIKEIYEKIGSFDCPALNAKVNFTSDGFHHLVYDACRKERSKKSQYNKFFYFKDAAGILKLSTTIQEYRKNLCPVGSPDKSGFRRTKIVEWFGFQAILNFKKGIRIVVVVRRIGEDAGQYHFWSVMPIWNLSGKVRIIGSKQIEDT